MIGLFFWCYAGWGLIVRVSLRRTPDRRGRRKVLLAGLVVMGLGFCSFGLVNAASPWLIVVPALVVGTGHALVYHTMTSLAIEAFPTEVRGTGTALSLMAVDVGFFTGAPLLGLVADAWGFAWMFAMIGTLTLSAASIYACSSIPVWQERREQHRNEEEDTSHTSTAQLVPKSVEDRQRDMAISVLGNRK